MAGSDADDGAAGKAGASRTVVPDGAGRADRLAAAMRENLRRRKVQQRARSTLPAADVGEVGPPGRRGGPEGS